MDRRGREGRRDSYQEMDADKWRKMKRGKRVGVDRCRDKKEFELYGEGNEEVGKKRW